VRDGDGSRTIISEADERRYCEMYPKARLGGRFVWGQSARVNAQCDFHHVAPRPTRIKSNNDAVCVRHTLVEKREIKTVKTPIDLYSKAPPVTLGVVAAWLLAIALGVAFWTLLLHAAPAIVGLIERR
jgi:hypothetical protein